MTELSSSQLLNNMVTFSPRRREVPNEWLRDELDAIHAEPDLLNSLVNLALESKGTFKNQDNSSVLYVIGLTDKKPGSYPKNLTVNRGKGASLCDIDLDFDSRYREHMVNYCIEKYGSDRVARIITFGSIKSRNAIRDAARVMGHPYAIGDKIAKKLPPLLFGKDTPIEACLVEDPKHLEGFAKANDFRGLYNNDTDAREVIDVAKGLEGLRRSDGIHAAAVVIAPDPLTNYVPVQRKPVKNSKLTGPITTQYDMNYIEKLGLLKMDFLALRNLDVITDACKMAGINIDDDNSYDDPQVYDLLAQGKTIGVFQLESSPMRSLLFDLKPDHFGDIAAVLALYRPGPMAANMHNDYADRKNGRQIATPFHPDAEELLAETHQLMIFQETLMSVARKFAGYSLAEADNLRKACGKKLPEEMEKERDKFTTGVIDNNYGGDFATKLFDMISAFSAYAFPKAHAYGYAVIAYQTAYLKVHYPVEYMAALMTSVQSDHDKLTTYLNEAKAMGIEVTCPDINRSQVDFSPDGDDTIVFGFMGIKNVGENPSRSIVEERSSNGDFKSFFDYARRAPKVAVNKKVVTALVGSGTFDDLGHPRKGLAQVATTIVQSESKKRQEEEDGIMTLFDMAPEAVSYGIPHLHWSDEERLILEKECLGVYVSGHPMAGVEIKGVNMTIGEIAEMEEGNWKRFRIAGIVLDVHALITRKGDQMKKFGIEDMSGRLECILFPRQTQEYGDLVNDDDIVYLDVKPKDDGGQITLIVNEVKTIKGRQQMQPKSGNVHLYVPENADIQNLKSKIHRSKGKNKVILHTKGGIEILPEVYQSNADTILEELR